MACSLVLDTQAKVSAHLRALEDIEITVPDFDKRFSTTKDRWQLRTTTRAIRDVKL